MNIKSNTGIKRPKARIEFTFHVIQHKRVNYRLKTTNFYLNMDLRKLLERGIQILPSLPTKPGGRRVIRPFHITSFLHIL